MRVLVRQVRGRKEHPNWQGIVKEVEKTIDAVVKPRVLNYATRVVANWAHKPAFKARKSVSRGGIIVYVYPSGENAKYWIWTSRGTKPHKIRPRRAKVLAFPSVYIPKTTPRGPSYGGPGTSSGPTRFAQEVDHPGTKARHFEEAWARWARTWYKREIDNAMRRGARRA